MEWIKKRKKVYLAELSTKSADFSKFPFRCFVSRQVAIIYGSVHTTPDFVPSSASTFQRRRRQGLSFCNAKRIVMFCVDNCCFMSVNGSNADFEKGISDHSRSAMSVRYMIFNWHSRRNRLRNWLSLHLHAVCCHTYELSMALNYLMTSDSSWKGASDNDNTINPWLPMAQKKER